MLYAKINKLSFVLVSTLMACGSAPSNKTLEKDSISIEQKSTVKALDPAGNYVSADYEQRSKGYDWVAVTVESTDQHKIRIKIRSRADLKKPTCTLDTEAMEIGAGVFEAHLSNGIAVFEFKDGNLSIRPKTEKDAGALYFYCSGGASIAGNYHQTTAKLDTVQVK